MRAEAPGRQAQDGSRPARRGFGFGVAATAVGARAVCLCALLYCVACCCWRHARRFPPVGARSTDERRVTHVYVFACEML